MTLQRTRPAPTAHLSALDEAQLGLDECEAARRLAQQGPNELPSAKPRSLAALTLDVLREPMLLLLIACGGIYLALGNAHEAAMLLVFVFIVIAIELLQQHKAERALDALKRLSSPRALVLRRGERLRIPGREVVAGDVVVLSDGDRVPADGVLLYTMNLRVDESLLTGESVHVSKRALDGAAAQMCAPGGGESACVYSGSLIVQGNALLQVLATGTDTAIGRIGAGLANVQRARAPMEMEVRRVVSRVAASGLLLSLALALGYGFGHGQWLQGFLIGITTAMALLPEELPVVMTLFLSLGAWRLAQQKVLTRRLAAIEALGTVTALCVDKTGTLTENRMRVQRLFANHRAIDMPSDASLPEAFHALLEFGLLASHRTPFDPMELAIHGAVAATLADTEHVHADWQLVEEYPLSRELLAMSRVWHGSECEQYAIAAKGAPEAIVDLCHLPATERESIAREVAMMAAEGLRVIGVARANFDMIALPTQQHDFDFEFLGLIGLADPVRAEVPGAIAECHRAGIRVIMITGDHASTALQIAAQIGLDTSAGFLSGAEVARLEASALSDRVAKVNVFCRVSPEQKLRLVETLKNRGEVAAMTGDGVNDAPAIRAAHVGIAMGARGTDVARESADLVLLDDAFGSIVAGIAMGRRIYSNLCRAITFLIAVHVPIVALAVLPLIFGWPLLLQPVHVLFLQLLIDPVCSIVFEAAPEDRAQMHQPPRSMRTHLFTRAILLRALLQGGLLTVVLGALTAWFFAHDVAAANVRTIVYATLMLANLGLILSNLSRAPLMQRLRAPAFAWTACGTLAALAAVLFISPLRELFLFAPMSTSTLLLTAAIALACFAAFEAVHVLVARARSRQRR